MQTVLLYKLVLTAIATVAFFFHHGDRYRLQVRTALYTATGLMAILCTNEMGFFGTAQALIALGLGVGLGWCFDNGLSALGTKFHKKKLR